MTKNDKKDIEESLEEIADTIKEKAEELKDKADKAADKVAATAEDLVDKAEQAASDMADKISDEVVEPTEEIAEDEEIVEDVEAAVDVEISDEGEKAVEEEINAEDCGCGCNDVNNQKFEDIFNDAKNYVVDAVNSIPTDEIKNDAAKAGGAIKDGLLEHGIDLDVLGAKLQEDFSELADTVASGIAKGASAVAGAVENAARTVRERAEGGNESTVDAEEAEYEPVFDEDGNRVATIDPTDEDHPIKY